MRTPVGLTRASQAPIGRMAIDKVWRDGLSLVVRQGFAQMLLNSSSPKAVGWP